ncbi:MAG: VOC family protein [Amaricoccus sp.]|uniref:bleomycin resistance protein n=1 Tax=Amaricoccus sp. TaxID=1872485 RepID=UPI0039E434D1
MAAALVPEFAVRDWETSLRFYRDTLGFEVRYLRRDEGFAYLALGAAELMLDQIGLGRAFDPLARADRLGCGVNVQIRVPAIHPLMSALARDGHPLHLAPEERWYRREHHGSDPDEVGHRQFVVADPDGYLLRFYEDLGRRSL